MKNFLGFALTVLLAPAAQAQEIAPDVLVKTITQDVIAIIKQDKDIQAGDPAKIAELIETKILLHFNFARMTQIAMGRNWRVASPEQQKELTSEFRTLLVRTYSTALTNYRNQVIEFKPLRAKPEDTDVTVKSEAKQPGAQAVTIDYEMEKTPGGWKVYDVKVAGVSLVTTYRETFAGEVREHGVDGLIKSLTAKNRENDARFKSGKT
ncbi:MAG TPA: ABC transporter substrate-binding protein [Burkholderiales bacterium]|nr:ABC transporter substrate-binding protein [Burkholderiales bacterium]